LVPRSEAQPALELSHLLRHSEVEVYLAIHDARKA